jgi:hypothetical protein
MIGLLMIWTNFLSVYNLMPLINLHTKFQDDIPSPIIVYDRIYDDEFNEARTQVILSILAEVLLRVILRTQH